MKDFDRLVSFAELIGVRVVQGEPSKDDAATFVYDKEDPCIEMDLAAKKGHHQCLILLHELGHAVDWIMMGRPHQQEIPTALEGEDELKQHERRIVFEYEKRAVDQMLAIYLLLDLKLPLWKLELERRFDLWVADHFLTQGVYPSRQARIKYRQDLKKMINKRSVNSWRLI